MAGINVENSLSIREPVAVGDADVIFVNLVSGYHSIGDAKYAIDVETVASPGYEATVFGKFMIPGANDLTLSRADLKGPMV